MKGCNILVMDDEDEVVTDDEGSNSDTMPSESDGTTKLLGEWESLILEQCRPCSQHLCHLLIHGTCFAPKQNPLIPTILMVPDFVQVCLYMNKSGI